MRLDFVRAGRSAAGVPGLEAGGRQGPAELHYFQALSTSTGSNAAPPALSIFLAVVLATEVPDVNTFDCDGEMCFGVCDCGSGMCVLQGLIQKLWKICSYGVTSWGCV